MNKTKILIFIDWYLPGYKAGGPIQSVANLVAHLKSDFDISIITRDTDYSETIPYTEVKSNKWITTDGVRIYYVSKDQLSYSTMYRLIEAESFDSVYLNGVYSVYFTLIPLFILRKKKVQRIVVAARGMLSPGSLNVKKTKKQLFLRMIKMAKLFSGVTFHATTEAEHQDIRAILGDKISIKTAGNLAAIQKDNTFTTRLKQPGTLRLGNVARIAPEKNLLQALLILKEVKTTVEFDFYGPVYNTTYWEECKKVLKTLPANVKATYKECIESDRVMQVLKNHHFLFMPTTGENFGHIILQAFSASCPVIISNLTPWKKLEEKKCGWDIPLTSTEQFVNVIERANAMTQAEYDAWSKSAFDQANSYINNAETLQKNKELFY
ncbi:MAG TPA: glycosyltransferase family 4 protein [Bacteroidia bacterium]|nr:glycosyltransferase family 4 protein [Bacteroidia bacterium]